MALRRRISALSVIRRPSASQYDQPLPQRRRVMPGSESSTKINPLPDGAGAAGEGAERLVMAIAQTADAPRRFRRIGSFHPRPPRYMRALVGESADRWGVAKW